MPVSDVTLPEWETQASTQAPALDPSAPATGAETFRDALRRALPLIVALMVLGAIAVNGLQMLRGERYEASAQVLVSSSQLSQILTGTQPAYIDPQRVQDTAQALASAPAVYRDAARRGRLGSASSLQAATSVSSNSGDDILRFTATATSPQRAVSIVNAVASAYTRYRATLTDTSIRTATTRLRQALADPALAASDRSALQRQLDRLTVLQTLSTSDAVLVDPAAGASKTNPRPLRDTILGLSIGLVIALIAVAVREAVDTKVRSDGTIEQLLSAPVVGTIASLPRGTRLVSNGRREAPFADAYGLLAAWLSISIKNLGRTPVVAVTSALPTEGKTTTSANLAVAIARRGQRVLLADFDFRKASLGDVFDIPADTIGALQVIDGAASLEDALWTVSLDELWPQHEPERHVRAPAGGSLRLLPAGGTVGIQHTGQPGELAWLVRHLRGLADVVLLDTPAALLTVEMAETSRLVDRILVVVRQGRITQRSLRSLERQSRSWEAPIAGVVMTDTPAGADQYSSYGAYSR
jgi:Mrp family chromosome partitioning ATPase